MKKMKPVIILITTPKLHINYKNNKKIKKINSKRWLIINRKFLPLNYPNKENKKTKKINSKKMLINPKFRPLNHLNKKNKKIKTFSKFPPLNHP